MIDSVVLLVGGGGGFSKNDAVVALALVQLVMEAWIPEPKLSLFNQDMNGYMYPYGLGHGAAAVLLPGFAIRWLFRVTGQPRLRESNHM